MLATTIGRSGEEMGYNLIRMHIMSGWLTDNVKDYCRVETLPGCMRLHYLEEIQLSLSMRFSGRVP